MLLIMNVREFERLILQLKSDRANHKQAKAAGSEAYNLKTTLSSKKLANTWRIECAWIKFILQRTFLHSWHTHSNKLLEPPVYISTWILSGCRTPMLFSMCVTLLCNQSVSQPTDQPTNQLTNHYHKNTCSIVVWLHQIGDLPRKYGGRLFLVDTEFEDSFPLLGGVCAYQIGVCSCQHRKSESVCVWHLCNPPYRASIRWAAAAHGLQSVSP